MNKVIKEDTTKLKTEIPDNPFDNVDTDDEILPDDGIDLWYEPNDEDGVSDEAWKKIEVHMKEIGWLEEEKNIDDSDELLQDRDTYLLRGFYCYVISEMEEENLGQFLMGYRKLIQGIITSNKNKELPEEIKDDEVTMDFRKELVKKESEKLSDFITQDLLGRLDKIKNTDMRLST